jgi:hypothetical protein
MSLTVSLLSLTQVFWLPCCHVFLLSYRQAGDYSRWSAAPRDASYTEDTAVCMEYLPQQPKTWNPFSCVSTPAAGSTSSQTHGRVSRWLPWSSAAIAV